MNKGSFKSLFSFEFWQKFGKALMVVIAVMPAAGLMLSLIHILIKTLCQAMISKAS